MDRRRTGREGILLRFGLRVKDLMRGCVVDPHFEAIHHIGIEVTQEFDNVEGVVAVAAGARKGSSMSDIGRLCPPDLADTRVRGCRVG